MDKAVDELTNAIFEQAVEEPKAAFKTREVYYFIRHQFFGLKREYEKTQELKFALQRHKIFSSAESSRNYGRQFGNTKKPSNGSPEILLNVCSGKNFPI